MKKIIALFLGVLPLCILAQNELDSIQLKSSIKEVKVFFSGAQVFREIPFNLPAGKHLLEIEGLTNELDPESMQVAGLKGVSILAVRTDEVLPNGGLKQKKEKALDKESARLENRIVSIKNQLSVYRIEEKLLLENADFVGNTRGAQIEDIKGASDFYRKKLNEIKQNSLELKTKLIEVGDSLQEVFKELNSHVTTRTQYTKRLLVGVELVRPLKGKLKFNYIVKSAGWSPVYDFRVSEVNEPLMVDYKANVFQSTQENWNKVKLTLSSNNPYLSGEKPQLKPWYLGQNRKFVQEKGGDKISGVIKGKVFDGETGEPLPFVNLVLKKGETTIQGGTTDLEGSYTIKPIPEGNYDLVVTFVGYTTRKVNGIRVNAQRITFQDVPLSSGIDLAEFEVVQYSVPLIDKDGGASGGTVFRDDISRMPARAVRSLASSVGGIGARGSRSNAEYYYVDGVKVRKNSSENLVPNSVSEQATHLEYKIEVPYTILSDGKDYSIGIKRENREVKYKYFVVPRAEQNAFLAAEISDWEQMRLLSGPMNVYFNGTFTGSNFLDANVAVDTLAVPLGRDKGIVAVRTLNKSMYSKKLIGSTVKEVIAWDIEVRNNKQVPISVLLEDQVPLSQNKNSMVNIVEFGGGDLDPKTGVLEWNLELEPGEVKSITYQFEVKYPEHRHYIFD